MNQQPKALLPLGGRRIIDRQLEALRQVADPVFIVASDPSPFEALGILIVGDAVPGCGALGGVYTAILESPRHRTIVVACDLPFLDVAFLRRLSEPSPADVIVPRTARGYEPLCALYTKACAEPIRRRLECGALQASTLPEGVRIEEIGPEALAAYDPDDRLFVNVNTPHDYERAVALLDPTPQPTDDRIMGGFSRGASRAPRGSAGRHGDRRPGEPE